MEANRKRGYDEASSGDGWDWGNMQEFHAKRPHLYNNNHGETTNNPEVNIPVIVAKMSNQNTEIQKKGIQDMRGMLSGLNPLDIEMLRKFNIVPTFIKFLQRYDCPMLQYEAILGMTDIASNSIENATLVIRQNAIPYIIHLIRNSSANIAEHGVWALLNIAIHGPELRDVIIHNNAVEHLIPLMNLNTQLTLLRSIVWLIFNMVRIKNLQFYNIKIVLPYMANILATPDLLLREDVCWVFAFLTDGNNVNIQAVIESGAVKYFTQYLDAEPCCILPSLRCLGNISKGTDSHIEAVVNSGCLSKLSMLLGLSGNDIAKAAAWTVSNITSGNQKHIQAVLDSGIFVPIKNIFENGNVPTQTEAVRAVTNITVYGVPEQIMCMIEKFKIMRSFAELIKVNELPIVHIVQTGLLNMFSLAYKSANPTDLFLMVQEMGGIRQLEALKQHEQFEVRYLATRIIDLCTNKEEQCLSECSHQ